MDKASYTWHRDGLENLILITAVITTKARVKIASLVDMTYVNSLA